MKTQDLLDLYSDYLISAFGQTTGTGLADLLGWNVEPYHKSLKQNASLEKSPTQTVTTQTNHLLASLWAYVKLEWLHKATHLNHFALESKLYVAALHSAFAALRQLQAIHLPA